MKNLNKENKIKKNKKKKSVYITILINAKKVYLQSPKLSPTNYSNSNYTIK